MFQVTANHVQQVGERDDVLCAGATRVKLGQTLPYLLVPSSVLLAGTVPSFLIEDGVNAHEWAELNLIENSSWVRRQPSNCRAV